MRYEGRFHLSGRNAVAGHVHDVVDAAEQPVVALLVALAAVAGEVAPRVLRPVGLLGPLGIGVDAAPPRRPGPLEDEVTAPPEGNRGAALVDDVGRHAGERE